MGFGRVFRRVVGMAMVVAMTMGAVMFAGLIIPALLGFKLMIVTSGSMEPTFSAGDVVILERVETREIDVGDVITFTTRGGRGMTTHRVTQINFLEGQTQFQTKGDANATADANLTPSSVVYGRMRYTVPTAGRVLIIYQDRIGRALIVGFPALVLLIRQFAAFLRRNDLLEVSEEGGQKPIAERVLEPHASEETTRLPAAPQRPKRAYRAGAQSMLVSSSPPRPSKRSHRPGAHSIRSTKPKPSSHPKESWDSATSTCLVEVSQ